MITRFIQFSILLGLLLVGITAHAQSGVSREIGPNYQGGTRGLLSLTEKEVNDALRNGDVASIAYHFDENVEITLPNKSGSFSKMQAQFVMKEFFNGNAVTSFAHRHASVSTDKTSRYTIAEYGTAKGVFEVKITYKNKNGNFKINSIQVMQ